MRYILPPVAAIMLIVNSGCATANIKTVTAEGKQCEAQYTTLFLAADAETISACGGKSSTSGKQVNTALVEALLKALVAVP